MAASSSPVGRTPTARIDDPPKPTRNRAIEYLRFFSLLCYEFANCNGAFLPMIHTLFPSCISDAGTFIFWKHLSLSLLGPLVATRMNIYVCATHPLSFDKGRK